MILDGIVGFRVPTRHHARSLLLPLAGDPILDRYWIAQLAREVLQADYERRNRDLQRQLRSGRANR